jgi:hypothetical protein
MSELAKIKAKSLLLFARVGEIQDYEKNAYLESARERLAKLIEEIDSKNCSNVVIAKLQIANIGDEINRGICGIAVGECLENLLKSIEKMREGLFAS